MIFQFFVINDQYGDHYISKMSYFGHNYIKNLHFPHEIDKELRRIMVQCCMEASYVIQ